jgi:hypothetical protein
MALLNSPAVVNPNAVMESFIMPPQDEQGSVVREDMLAEL